MYAVCGYACILHVACQNFFEAPIMSTLVHSGLV